MEPQWGFPYSVDVRLPDGRQVYYEGIMLASDRAQACRCVDEQAALDASRRNREVIALAVNTHSVCVIGV
jgi:hypothetical protein